MSWFKRKKNFLNNDNLGFLILDNIIFIMKTLFSKYKCFYFSYRLTEFKKIITKDRANENEN